MTPTRTPPRSSSDGTTLRALPHTAVLVIALLAILGLFAPSTARACSCVEPGPSLIERLEHDNVAFIGTVVEAFPARFESDVTYDEHYRVRVERTIKGRLPRWVDVVSPHCGERLTVGSTVGIVTSPVQGRLTTSLCEGVVSASALGAIADGSYPLARAAGVADALVLVDLAGPALVAVDAQGFVLGQRALDGTPTAIDLCPSERTAVVLSTLDAGRVRVETFDVASLTSSGQRVIRVPTSGPFGAYDEVACLAADASRVGIVAVGSDAQAEGAPHLFVENAGEFQPVTGGTPFVRTPGLHTDADGRIVLATRTTAWTTTDRSSTGRWWRHDDPTDFLFGLFAENRIALFESPAQHAWPRESLPGLERLRARLAASRRGASIVLAPLDEPPPPAVTDAALRGMVPVVAIGAGLLAGWLHGRRRRGRG